MIFSVYNLIVIANFSTYTLRYMCHPPYMVYPMSFLLHVPSIAQGSDERSLEECDYRCLCDYNVTLVLGVQDNKGAVAKINLGRLFTTMVRPGQTERRA